MNHNHNYNHNRHEYDNRRHHEHNIRYKVLSDDDIDFFIRAIGAENVAQTVVKKKKKKKTQSDNEDGNNYDDKNDDVALLNDLNTDWQKKYFGKSKCALFPRTSEEVSEILRYCYENHIAVCPQGGNTGLVGGAVPVFDEVILSLKRMNSVLSIDDVTGVCVCEAGVVLEDLDDALTRRGMCVPLDLGAKGKCQIGGNVSTNAGGLRLVKYGSLRGTVLGLEVVLADGTILSSLLRENRKDNTGYDLKQLFIGAEGTLGVVTKVAILAPRAPEARIVTIYACDTFDNVVGLMVEVKKRLAENLSAVEFFDRESLKLTVDTLPGAKDPFPYDEDNNNKKKDVNEDGLHTNNIQFYVAVETTVNEKSMESRLRATVLSFSRSVCVLAEDGSKSRGNFMRILPRGDKVKKNKDLARQFLISKNEKHANELWNLRERISVALKYAGAVYKYDVSLPTTKMYELVERMRERFAERRMDEEVKVLGYGHLGDGNLHLNISRKKGPCKNTLAVIEPFVYDYVTEHKGSISAEHGLGAMKVQELWRGKDAEEVRLMQRVKNMFDPRGILNPHKMIPSSPSPIPSKL
jgi:D-2-hydroxyglutarate dehydrogenase